MTIFVPTNQKIDEYNNE